jgi:putative SOS response-associated peptidase YedK
MCNDYGNRIPYSAYLEAFSHLKIRLFAPGGAPNLEPRDDIWPTDVAPIIRANKDGAELIQLRWAVRKAAISARPLPGAGVTFLRVYRKKITEGQVALHQSR